MPSGPPELWKVFPNGDSDALDAIEDNFVVDKGFVIRPKVKGYKPTYRESLALDHLFLEWDYAYEAE